MSKISKEGQFSVKATTLRAVSSWKNINITELEKKKKFSNMSEITKQIIITEKW